MKKMLAVLIAILGLQAPAMAAISVNPDFKGTVLMTKADGNVEMIEEGNEVPAIPNNSTLEVFNGSVTIQTEQGDQAALTCHANSISVGGGASASLTCGETSGKLKALKSDLKIALPNGKEALVKEGSEFDILSAEAPIAPPTEAGTPLGGDPAGGDLADAPPVDSRSIQASPST